MSIISVYGSKGGVGTTTLAASICAVHPRSYLHSDDGPAVSGLPPVDPEVPRTVNFGPNGGPIDLHVFDLERSEIITNGVFRVGLVTNTYLSLRQTWKWESSPHVLVCRFNKNFALDWRDVESALGREVLLWKEDDAVTLAVDAGLLSYRIPLDTRKLCEKIHRLHGDFLAEQAAEEVSA